MRVVCRYVLVRVHDVVRESAQTSVQRCLAQLRRQFPSGGVLMIHCYELYFILGPVIRLCCLEDIYAEVYGA